MGKASLGGMEEKETFLVINPPILERKGETGL